MHTFEANEAKLERLHLECVQYLKSNETERIMKGLWAKYRSYGDVMGILALSNLTENERLFLRGLLKKKVTPGVSFRVSLKAFEDAFVGTVYEGVSLPRLLEGYFGKPIESKKEGLTKALRAKQDFIESIKVMLAKEQNTHHLAQWVSEALLNSQHKAYKLVNGFYMDAQVSLEGLIGDLEALIRCLEAHEGGIGIPVAAGVATGNPHALDRGMPLRKLLVYYGSERYGLEIPKTLHETDVFFEMLNLNVDESPRLVLTYGLEAFDVEGRRMGWDIFSARCEPLNLSTQNLKSVRSLRAISDNIWCYENPSTFFRSIQKSPQNAAICTSGQPNLLVYKVLDKLVDRHGFVYSGDFDPEGLLIANRLKNRYLRMDLSFFSVENYHLALSNEVISETRLKQLKQLTDAGLQLVGAEMRCVKRAGYEERL